MGWSKPKRFSFEGPEPILGAGVSRPNASEATRQYRMTVKQPGKPVMRVVMPAPTKAKAITYCKNRWPDAVVEPIR